MCNIGRLVALLGMAVGGRAPLDAQQVAAARYRELADSLAAEWRMAVAAATRAESLGHQQALAGRDTVRAGHLVLLVSPEVSVARMRAAAMRAWQVLDSAFGDAARDVSSRALLVDVAGKPGTPGVTGPDIGVAPDAGVDEIVAILVTRIPQVFSLRADPALAQWLGTPLVPTTGLWAAERAVYVDLVTAPSRAATGCLAGPPAECRSALGLGAPGEAVFRWYDAAERRAVAQRFRFYLNRPPNLELYAACVGARQDRACADLLNAAPPGVLPQPLGAAARLTLVHVALRSGGRDAYTRLVSHAADPLPDRLAAAARLSVDSLVTLWRREIERARPAPVSLPAAGLILALSWTLLFGACSLRSSRWRRG